MAKTLVAIPCMQKLDTDFATSLMGMERMPDTHFSFLQGSLVYDSRNTFAVNAITEGYERILFIDSDMVLPPDTLKALSADMDTGLEYVSALFFNRQAPIKPMIYKTLRSEVKDLDLPPVQEVYADYPEDQLFRIEGSGFGCVMVSVDLVRKVWDAYGPAFMPTPVMGEDLAFCWRVKKLGVPMWCDSRVKVGHIGPVIYNEQMYRQQKKLDELRAMMPNGRHWPHG